MKIKEIGQLVEDIKSACRSAEVEYDENKILEVLNAYQENFQIPITPVTFRTTTKDKEHRNVNVRYVDFWTVHDPYNIALEKQLIEAEDTPLHKLFDEIKSKFPVMGYGIDFSVDYGLEKIWSFFAPFLECRIEQTYEMENLPESIINNRWFYEQFNLKAISLLGLDYRNKSVNIYYMRNFIGDISVNMAKEMIKSLGFSCPDDEILDYCSRASTFYCTYTWTSPSIERICFGILEEDIKQVPIHLNPVMKKYTDEGVFLNDRKRYIYSIALSKDAYYIKIENDYSGTMVDFMKEGGGAAYKGV